MYQMLPPGSFVLQGNGDCSCKAHVTGDACDTWEDGCFALEKSNYFGCQGKYILQGHSLVVTQLFLDFQGVSVTLVDHSPPCVVDPQEKASAESMLWGESARGSLGKFLHTRILLGPSHTSLPVLILG
ncbi:Laminin subunit alpha-3 [Lemmus lemmus]